MSKDMIDSIADCLVQDHIDLINENKRLSVQIETQAKEIEEMKTRHVKATLIRWEQFKVIEAERDELRAALVVAVDALNKAEWSNRKLEELGRMAALVDAAESLKEAINGMGCSYALWSPKAKEALTRCKELLK